MEGDAPEQAHRREQPERRHDDRDERHDLADPARPRPDGADRVTAVSIVCPVPRWRRVAVITTVIRRSGEYRFDEDRGRRQRRSPASAPRYLLVARARRRGVRARRRAPAATRTRSAHDGLALDTGFLVHNDAQLPAARPALPRARRRDADVGDVVLGQLRGCGLEYSGRRPFAQPRERARARASSRCSGRSAAGSGPPRARSTEPTTRLHTLGATSTSTATRAGSARHFLVPLTSALWSTAPGRALEFPAAYAIRFFDNHGMLGFGRFRWRDRHRRQPTRTSRAIARAARAAPAPRRSASARCGATPDGVELTHRRRRAARASTRVVVATHADQALALLDDPSDDERRVLGALRVHDERGRAAHGRARSCRARAAARASWNYRLGDDGQPDDDLLPEPAPAARRPTTTTA